MSLVSTTVVGYSDTLPVLEVKLPLKYFNSQKKKQDFTKQLVDVGKIISLENVSGSFIDEISVSLLKDKTTIDIIPVVSQANSLDLSFQAIKLKLPHSVVSPACVSVQFIQDEEYLLLDLIDENFLFISVKILLEDFIVDSKKNINLTLENFSAWGHISVPYSFELRSAPFFFKAISDKHLIVSLKDGGLLHFQRIAPLCDYSVYTFNDPSSFRLSFFGWNKHSKEQEIQNNGISCNAIVDVVATSPNTIVTLSTDMKLKTWTLDNHQLFGSVYSLSKDNLQYYLSATSSSKFLQVNDNYIACHYFINKIAFVEFFEILPSGTISNIFKVTPLESNEVQWLIQDFHFQINEDKKFVLTILFKSNKNSFVAIYHINHQGKVQNTIKQPTYLQPASEIYQSINKKDSYYTEKILNSGTYDQLTVETSLNVLQEYLGSDLKNGAIRSNLVDTINNINSSWKDFDSVCMEFKKASEECISFIPRKNDILVLNTHSLSVVKEAHLFENYIETIDNPLANILKKLALKLSTKTYTKIFENLLNGGEITEEKVTNMYTDFLANKISKAENESLVTELVNMPNALGAIEELLNFNDNDSVLSSPIGRFMKLSAISSFKNIIEAHTSIILGLAILLILMEVNEPLLGLINKIVNRLSTYQLLNLVFNTNFGTSNKYTRNQKSQLGDLAQSLFWSLNQSPKSLLDYNYNKAFNSLLTAITSNYDDFVIDSVIQLINYDQGELVRRSFIDKLNAERPVDRFLIGFIHLINNDPDSFYQVFQNDLDLSTKSKLKTKMSALNMNENIKNFLDGIFEPTFEDPILEKANYYHSLSILSSSQGRTAQRQHAHSIISTNFSSSSSSSSVNLDESSFVKSALEFEQKAIEVLRGKPTPPKLQIEEYYYNVFDMALSLNRYDTVIDAISHIDDEVELKERLTRFINYLISNRNVDVLFPPTPQKELLKHYLLIDNILLRLANNELVLSNALTYYEYLYSWRLFAGGSVYKSDKLADKRGASEALYIFITRFKHEQNLLTCNSNTDVTNDIKQYKLKILELYMVILNCLKSFDSDEDKWIIRQQSSDSQDIITLEELNQEYTYWVKELEDYFEI